jgi:predicted GNAT family N-acyltransferase
MALRIIEHGSKDYLAMVELRENILRKPLGLTFSAEELDAEKDEILLAAFEQERLVACCLLTPSGAGTIRLRQMAVHEQVQGKGIGRNLIHFAESISLDRGFTKLSMHARKTATGFYQKMGYTICSPEFEEVTIPHYTMVKNLIPF